MSSKNILTLGFNILTGKKLKMIKLVAVVTKLHDKVDRKRRAGK